MMTEDQAAPVPSGWASLSPTARAHHRDLSTRVTPVAAAAARLCVLPRWWGSRSAATRDCGVALVFTVLSFAAPLSRFGVQFGDLPTHGASVASVLLSLGQTLPLAVRTRWPAACLDNEGSACADKATVGFLTTGHLPDKDVYCTDVTQK